MEPEPDESESRRMDALAHLAAAVAHDLNNVLGAVRGYAQIALRTLDSLPTGAESNDALARMAADLHAIVAATERGASVTGRLLAAGRRQQLDPVLVDLHARLAAAEPMLRAEVGEQVELRLRLDARPAYVRADPARLEEVLRELARNARQAMPGGGRLSVETSNVSSAGDVPPRRSLAPGAYVALALRDTGLGMDAATRERAFEPFFTTRDVGQGAGLGLSAVHGVARQMGGDVVLESAPGKGTTVVVLLPAADAPAAAAAARPAIPPADPADADAVREATVLVVEDEPSVRQLACTVLARLGHRVVPAAGGAEALRLLDALAADGIRPDLLVTDVVMPEMSGPDLAIAVARRHPGVGVIYMSGYSEHVVEQRGEMGAGTAFLDKPFTLEQFAARVREVLRATRSPAA